MDMIELNARLAALAADAGVTLSDEALDDLTHAVAPYLHIAG